MQFDIRLATEIEQTLSFCNYLNRDVIGIQKNLKNNVTIFTFILKKGLMSQDGSCVKIKNKFISL